MHFSQLSFFATVVLCALPSVPALPAPIDASLPGAVIPENSLNKLAMDEYIGTSSTIFPISSTTSKSGSSVPTSTSTPTSYAIDSFSLNTWTWGLTTAGTIFFTLL